MNTKRTDVDDALYQRIQDDLVDSFDEELELEVGDRILDARSPRTSTSDETSRTDRRYYFRELFRLQRELVKMQDWVGATKHRLVVLFEGRDAAGKGGDHQARHPAAQSASVPRDGTARRRPSASARSGTSSATSRTCRRAGRWCCSTAAGTTAPGVERVMGFCTDAEYEEFFRSVPEFERMLVRAGIQLVKYWFSITDDEQAFRFEARIHDPLKQWKLSPMDLESRRRWEAYTRAKEVMLERTHTSEAPWWVVQAVDKKRARLNCIHHLLSQVPYGEVQHVPIALPPRERHPDYHRTPVPQDMYVPEVY